MKQRFKLLTLAVALVAGLTMTSCLGDSDYQNQQSVIAKVVPNYTSGAMYKFVAADGFTIIPSAGAENSFASSMGNGFTMSQLNGTIVQVYYYWSSDDPNVEITDTSIDNVNFTLASLDYPTKVVPSAYQDTESVATHPVISLNPTDNWGNTLKPFFFDDTKSDIVVPISYYYPYGVQTTASMTLVYYPEDPATVSDKSNNTLRLYLNYSVLDKDGEEPIQFSTQYSSFGYFAFNLRNTKSGMGNILASWGGSTPEKVIITTKVSQYSTKLDDVQTESKDFEVVTVDELNAQ